MNLASQWYLKYSDLYWQRNQSRMDQEGPWRRAVIRALLPIDLLYLSWLEIGCGQGHNLCRGDCGIDLDDTFLAKIQEREAHLFLGTAESLPFLPTHSFPVVFCVGLLMHLQNYSKALEEMGRIASCYVLIGEYVGEKEVDLLWNPETGTIGDGLPGYLWKRPYDPPPGYVLQNAVTNVEPFGPEVTFLLFKRN